jgi:hypothetical protein
VNIEELSKNEFRAKIFSRELDRIADFDKELCDFLELLDNEYDDLDENLEQLLVDYLEFR